VKFLLPRAEEAPDLLPEGLRAMAADVHVVPVYRTLPDATEADAVRARIEAGEIDAVTFTSSSTVRNFRELFPDLTLSGVTVACIGPVTAASARELGLPVTVVPEEQNVRALVRVLVAHLAVADNIP
jgi:uroporphyrinogen III methyltransferase/synthase